MKLMVTWGSTILRTPLLKNPGRATVPRALMLGVPSGQAAVQIWEVESPLLSEKAIEGG